MACTKRMRWKAVPILVALFSLACGIIPFPTTAPPSAAWQSTVNALADLHAAQELPQHLQAKDAAKTGGEFDVNAYFSILDHLSMEPGYTLDYVYFYDFMGGRPFIYARPVEQAPYLTYSEYTVAGHTRDDQFGYMDHIQVDGTEEGFFQFVLLHVMGGQFYLHWHSGYDDWRIVCNRDELEDIITMLDEHFQPLTGEEKKAARGLELAPVIEFVDEDTVSVQVIVFGKWKGLMRGSYRISQDFPHTLLDVSYEDIVPYNCGIMF